MHTSGRVSRTRRTYARALGRPRRIHARRGDEFSAPAGLMHAPLGARAGPMHAVGTSFPRPPDLCTRPWAPAPDFCTPWGRVFRARRTYARALGRPRRIFARRGDEFSAPAGLMRAPWGARAGLMHAVGTS